MSEDLTVGRTADLVGVSVRTLHHWDAIGLARPSGRTWSGYRVYSDEDVGRLHRVLVYRELGFPLAEIGKLLDDPEVDARSHLRRQRSELVDRIDRLQTMVSSVDRMLEATRTGIQLSPAQQVEIFGAGWRPEWIDEAESRWGDTPHWAQYAERTATLTPDDWNQIATTTKQLDDDLTAALRSGLAANSSEANALAERHRALLTTYFDCTHSMHVCIARSYTDDPRYVEHYDKIAPGLSTWLRDSIFSNAATHGIDPTSAVWE
ncbi:MerR family transcriptional regulator [Kribbella sp. CA-293567]|uniref:MerR family transcriptional regulator n=1 Tax=Kribbella sp. CA-293567 TaxID=3002436 RepID=UPI0022DD80C6|nr:MerR family transcriptional regulator [Kribbella sp. CA-293567]WBQ07111.1 MerR family transcriptional regulator [Kribbella sp. CA-293567]